MLPSTTNCSLYPGISIFTSLVQEESKRTKNAIAALKIRNSMLHLGLLEIMKLVLRLT